MFNQMAQHVTVSNDVLNVISDKYISIYLAIRRDEQNANVNL